MLIELEITEDIAVDMTTVSLTHPTLPNTYPGEMNGSIGAGLAMALKPRAAVHTESPYTAPGSDTTQAAVHKGGPVPSLASPFNSRVLEQEEIALFFEHFLAGS